MLFLNKQTSGKAFLKKVFYEKAFLLDFVYVFGSVFEIKPEEVS